MVINILQQQLPGATVVIDHNGGELLLRIEHVSADPGAITILLETLGVSSEMLPAEPDKSRSNSAEDMRSFWSKAFKGHQTMWGFEPSRSAILAKDLLLAEGVKEVLIPGIGYGRNARVFLDDGISVTGIEIAQEAIDIARKHYGTELNIFQGSVTDMPFDQHLYQAIFCYGLVYLLNMEQRRKLIADCYRQLLLGGWMIFSVVSKKSPNYGKGKPLAKDTFEINKDGGQIFFYDKDSAQLEFGAYGIKDCFEIEEQVHPGTGTASFIFLQVVCRKEV